MPGLNGFQLMERVRVKHPQIKILLMSAYSTPEYADISIERGAEEFFEKPICFESLLRYLKGQLTKPLPEAAL